MNILICHQTIQSDQLAKIVARLENASTAKIKVVNMFEMHKIDDAEFTVKFINYLKLADVVIWQKKKSDNSTELISQFVKKFGTPIIEITDAEISNTDIDRVTAKLNLEVRKLSRRKFILILPHQMQRYLQWKANSKNLDRSKIVRGIIAKALESDLEFKSIN